jgi:anti-sigma factor RsiW
MKCEEAQELITALVDDELSDSELASIESHLRECARCQFAHRQEQALKTAVRAASGAVSLPADLKEKILSGLGRPGKGEALNEPQGPGWLSQLAFRPALAFALLLLLLLPVVYLMRSEPAPIALSALESHERMVAGSLSYIREENPEKLKIQLARSVDGRFGPMGYDLSMMGLRPVGGAVQEVAGRKIIVALYEGTAPSLTCYTFLGTERDVPKGAALFADPEKKINFYTFSHQGVNGVMHREGELICILVSEIPLPELLALARSKARPS